MDTGQRKQESQMRQRAGSKRARTNGAEKRRKGTVLKQNIFRIFYLRSKGRLETPFGAGWVSINFLKAKSSTGD